MKKFTLSIAAVLLLGATASAVPVKKASTARSLKEAAKVMNLPAQAPVSRAQSIIDNPPSGVAALMARDCEGFTIEGWEATHGPIMGSIARTVVTDNNEMYIGNPISEFPLQTWIKADIIGDTLSIRGAQPVYEEYDYDEGKWYVAYVVPMQIVVDDKNQGTCVPAEDMRYDLVKGEDGSYTYTDHSKMLCIATEMRVFDENNEPTGEITYAWAGYGDRDLVLYHDKGELVEIPEGLPIQRWVWTDEYDEAGSLVDVIEDGNDIYISGMDRSLPEAWVKGTIEGNKVYFPSGQFLGPDFEIMYFSYFCGADFDYETDPETGEEVRYASLAEYAIFDYDAERPTLFIDNGYIINSTPDRLFTLYAYDLVQVDNESRDVNAAPAAPYDLVYEENPDYNEQLLWFQVPNVDVDGCMLSPEYLYYEIFVNGDVLDFNLEGIGTTTRIPYTYEDYDIYPYFNDHTVYLPEPVAGTIGVRSVYINEEGNDLYSTITSINVNSGVNETLGAPEVVSVEWTDLSGRKIARPASGVAIRTVTYSDGSVAHSKVRVK